MGHDMVNGRPFGEAAILTEKWQGSVVNRDGRALTPDFKAKPKPVAPQQGAEQD